MAMSISIQKSAKRTNIEHNNRKMKEKEKLKNDHIDYTKSDTNKYLVQRDIKELYQTEFGGALENYNAKQKRNDRKIKNYYKHIEASKKTDVQQEMIIQIGDKDDFLNDEKREEAMAILEKWYEGFEERNPNLKVYNAVIHNDEASPHMHLNFVPVASGYKRGLEKQVAFDRALIQQDDSLDKDRPFTQWRENEVAVLEGLLNERGIERKLVGKNEYKDVREYKTEMDKQIEHFEASKRKLEELIAEAEDYEEPMAVLMNIDKKAQKKREKEENSLFSFRRKKAETRELTDVEYTAMRDIGFKGIDAMLKLRKMPDELAKMDEIEEREKQLKIQQEQMEREKMAQLQANSQAQERWEQLLEQKEKERQEEIERYEAQLEKERRHKAIVNNANMKLKAENNGLKAENANLKTDNDALRTENGVLRQENGRLKALKAEFDKYKEKAVEKVKTLYKALGDAGASFNAFVERKSPFSDGLTLEQRDIAKASNKRVQEVLTESQQGERTNKIGRVNLYNATKYGVAPDVAKHLKNRESVISMINSTEKNDNQKIIKNDAPKQVNRKSSDNELER